MKIFRRLKALRNLINCKMNPVKYARSLGVKVGERCRIIRARPTMFSTEPWLITIGNDVHITEDVMFVTHDGGTSILLDRMSDPGFVRVGNITIGDNTYIGIRSIILPGVMIGSNCIIGSGSVISRDIPDNTVAAGVPCRPICSIDDYLSKIEKARAGEDPRYYADLDYMHSLNPNRKR